MSLMDSRLGYYEILAPLGAGGMGEVYRARDTKLGREVAIKVLPGAFSKDTEKLARFEREAHLLASVNHPFIATLYGLEESNGHPFLVMELVEGETLAERLARGPMPIGDALALFQHIAEGLEAAHEKGVIHRDLKPSNIKIRPDGKPKILDFGLAKALAGEAVVQDLSQSPTLTRGATQTGVLLGTAPYMSPEQARGRPVDKRTDVWAFGCCLYEAMTGKAAFGGETVSDTIGKILEREPEWSALPKATSALVRSLLRRCLEKDANRRIHDIADARIEIEEGLNEPAAPADGPQGMSFVRRGRWGFGLAAGGVLLGGLIAWFATRPDWPALYYPYRLNIQIPPSLRMMDIGNGGSALAISPDGTLVVYAGISEDGVRRLYSRRLDGVDTEAISGTEGGYNPFFSPDGQWLGFGSQGDRELKKVYVLGGAPMTLCNANLVRGASWGEDGTIVFGGISGGLRTVSSEGGTAVEITALDGGERGHRWPQFLPGEKALIFSTYTDSLRDDQRTIAAVSLETGERKTLLEGVTDPTYVATGHLLYAREGSVFAAPFDPKGVELTGAPVKVIDDVRMSKRGSGAVFYDVSPTGTLLYVPRYPRPVDGTLVWVDRDGNVEPLAESRRSYVKLALSPEGDRLAVRVADANWRSDAWVYDLERRNWTRLSFTGEFGDVDETLLWTPDGERVVFTSWAERNPLAFWIRADGSGPPAPLLDHSMDELGYAYLSSFSPDGRLAVISDQNFTRNWDIYTLALDGHTTPEPFVVTPFSELQGKFSPDGRWIAYSSLESGRYEIYVRPYPGPGSKWTVSTDGGIEPLWSRDGRELFYRRGASVLAVSVSSEPDFRAGPPRVLFDLPDLSRSVWGGQYEVTPDSERFVMIQRDEAAEPLQLVLAPYFLEELKRLAPAE